MRAAVHRGTVVLATAAAVVLTSCTPSTPAPSPAPTVTASASEDPGGGTSLRPRYHHTAPQRWKNDPQRPLVLDGVTHYWYLYDDAYPEGGGTEWRLATSTDDVVLDDQGVAIPKGTTPNGDVWSGSAVLDVDGTAGLGAGAVLALVTQPQAGRSQRGADGVGGQAQFLWWSGDGGRSFAPVQEDPVIANDGRRDFRDPKVLWDDARGRWVALLAEGDAVSVWTSPDLRTWDEVSRLELPGIGTVECPDLFGITAADGTHRWVLGVSANARDRGDPATYAYWTGGFDGTTFVPDRPDPLWLDHGFDWYGAVTWTDPDRDPEHVRLAIAWLNSWAYARDEPPTWRSDGYDGTDSVVRELRLADVDGRWTLLSSPVATLADHAGESNELGDVEVEGHVPLDVRGVAYELRARLEPGDATNVGLQLRVSQDGTRHVDVGVDQDGVYVNRAGTGSPDGSGTLQESRSPLPMGSGGVDLRVLVDTTSVEVFVGDGSVVHSHLVFPAPADDGIALYALGGTARVRDLTVTPLG